MSTNILSLPEHDLGLQITFETSQDADWYDPFCWNFQQISGGVTSTVPVDLTGIAFDMNLTTPQGQKVLSVSTAAGTIVNSGASLAINVPVGTMAQVAAATYAGHLHAVADGHVRLVAQATIIHGPAV